MDSKNLFHFIHNMSSSIDVRENENGDEMPQKYHISNKLVTILMIGFCMTCLIFYYTKKSLSSLFKHVGAKTISSIGKLAAVNNQVLKDYQIDEAYEKPTSKETTIIVVVFVIVIVAIIVFVVVCCILYRKKEASEQSEGIQEAAPKKNAKKHNVEEEIEYKPINNIPEETPVDSNTEETPAKTTEEPLKEPEEVKEPIPPKEEVKEESDSNNYNSVQFHDEQPTIDEKPKGELVAYSPVTGRMHSQQSIERMPMVERKRLRSIKVEIKQQVMKD